MKKTNYLWNVLAVMAFALMSTVFTSCKHEPEHEPEYLLPGTWMFEDEEYDFRCYLTFVGNDKSGTYTYTEYEEGKMDGPVTGTYSYSNGYLTLYEEDGDDDKIKVISLTKTKLVLKDFFDEDDGNSTFVKVNKIDEPSILGTWKYSYDGGYTKLTFSGKETSGTVKVEEYDNGDIDKETGSFTYSDGYLTLRGFESESIRVVSLTETKLVLRDWPDGGNCTFYKQ